MQPAEATLVDIYERTSRAFGGAIGTIFLSLFGLAWILFALASLSRLHVAVAILLSCLVAGLLVSSVSTIRRTHGPVHSEQAHAARGKHLNRMLGLVNVVQWTAIFLAANLLDHFHHQRWIVPTIIFIVGAHFLPLAYLFRARLHYATGCALMIWAVAAPLLFSAHSMEADAALGAGILLWLTAIHLTLDSHRLVRGLLASSA